MSNHINPKKIKIGQIYYDVLFGEVEVTNIRDFNTDRFCKINEVIECQGKLGSNTIIFHYTIQGYESVFHKLPRLYKSNPFKS